MRLVTDLLWLSSRWVEEHQRAGAPVSLKTLSSRATSDGKLFSRIAAGAQISVAMWERCAIYLADPAHWPAGEIPADVIARLFAIGTIRSTAPSLQMAG
jgi:hypothetical protein